MKKSIMIERPDGQIINALYAEPETPLPPDRAPLIIFVRGFPAYTQEENNIFDTLSESITKSHISCLQFNFTGTDLNAQDCATFSFAEAAKDLETIYSWARKHGYKSFAFITEGLGAALTLMNTPKDTRFCASFWPIYDLSHVYKEQMHIDDHQQKLDQRGFFEREGFAITQDFADELKNTDLSPYLQNADFPVLLLHGMQDTVIPPSQLDIARKSLASPRIDITTFDDGAHGLENENHRKACLNHIKMFIATHASRPKRVKE